MSLYRGHVPVAPSLHLPRRFHFAQRYLAAFDRDLRLRRSAENPRFYVLERRKRRTPARFTGLRDQSDQHIQARDGYDHVGLVHPALLPRPQVIVFEMVANGWDLWGSGGSLSVATEVEDAEVWAKENRRRRRKQMFREAALEHYDYLDRHGNGDGTERTRINNVGLPAAASSSQAA